jgi:hypothetical protein
MKICVVILISLYFNVNWCGVVEALVLELTPSLVMIDYDDTRIQLSLSLPALQIYRKSQTLRRTEYAVQ